MTKKTRSKTGIVASGDDFLALREDEVAVAPPETFDASLYFIGRIRTPWRSSEESARVQCDLHRRARSALDARAQGT
jgi:hypothetical protein